VLFASLAVYVSQSAFSDDSSGSSRGEATPKATTTPTTIAPSKITASSTTNQTVNMPTSSLNLAAIALGTGKSTTTPKKGYLYRCGGTPSGGPPVTIPPWVNTSNKTWSAKSKLASGGNAPKTIATPRCEAGAVGISIDGIPILDGFDAGGNDASAVEVQDTCHGHPNNFVGYHYHSLSPCILSTTAKTHATQVGWALDGFGIYVEYNSKGQLLTNSSLDVCHGRTSVVSWHGQNVKIYHYDMTYEFPYSIGCFRGTPKSFAGMTIS